MTLRPRRTLDGGTDRPCHGADGFHSQTSRRATKRWNSERGSTLPATVTIGRPFATMLPRDPNAKCPQGETTGGRRRCATSSRSLRK